MQYISVREAAQAANVTERYIQAEINRGNLRAKKLNQGFFRSPWQIERPSFDRWMQDREKQRAHAS